MQSTNFVADNRSELLTKQATALIGRPSQFVAREVAPDISRAGLVLGRYMTYQNVDPVPDQLGELMDPNVLDIKQRPDQLDFAIEDHELIAKVSHQFVASMRENGFNDGQIDEYVTQQLTMRVMAMQEVVTANIVKNANSYASGLVDQTAKDWSGSGDPMTDIKNAIASLDGVGADTDSLYMVASPSVWQALTTKLSSQFSGIQARITPEDIAGLFGAKAVKARYSITGQGFVYGDSFQIFSRPEMPTETDLCAWRTVNAGMSGQPEPTIYKYWPEGHRHRYYVIGCYHDYKVIPTGAGSDGKQKAAFLFTDTLT